MRTCNINVLALGTVCQVSAMDAVSTSQLPVANDMYGQLIGFGDNITSHHC